MEFGNVCILFCQANNEYQIKVITQSRMMVHIERKRFS